MPPPARGRCGEFDGRPVFFHGVGGESSAASSIQQLWSLEAIFLSTSSAVGESRPTSKVFQRPIQKPVKGSGTCLTSKVRPISRSANTLNISTAASGFVPASEHDGGSFDLQLDGGEREGSDYILPSFSEVFSAITRDICVIFFLMGSFVTTCTSIAYS
jgi:hypothetical protein